MRVELNKTIKQMYIHYFIEYISEINKYFSIDFD